MNMLIPTIPPRRRPRPPKRSPNLLDAADRRLNAAEVLFAQKCFYGVNTREVATAAAVDDALIYYHFGNKRSLFSAVFSRRADILNRARHESMETYKTTNTSYTTSGVIASFMDPMFEFSTSADPGWKSYFALVAQVDNTPWGSDTIHEFFDSSVYELLDLMKLALPGSDMKEMFWAYNFLAGSMMLTLSETERVDRLSGGLCKAKELEAVRSRLITYCAGGFEALVLQARKESGSMIR